MSTDYSKKKNAELEELLKARSLPHTGKKADLVARLQEDDAKRTPSSTSASVARASKSTPTKKPAPAAPQVTEDVIDWEDDTTSPITEPVPSKPIPAQVKATKPKPTEPSAPVKAAGAGAAPTPIAVPNQIAAIDPSKTSDLTISAPAPISTPASSSKLKPTPKPAPTSSTPAEPETFTSHLPSTNPDTELAKRAARAARFGIPNSSAEGDNGVTTEQQKAQERAAKFGTVEKPSVTAALDRALPDRGTKRGRGAEENGGRSESKRGRREGSDKPGRRPQPRETSKPNGRKRGGEVGTGNGAGARNGKATNKAPPSRATTKPTPNPAKPSPTPNQTANAKSSSEKKEKDRQAAEARKQRFAPDAKPAAVAATS